MLKCQFHSHAAGDPIDNIPHSPKELIDRAKKLGYDVLAITCHQKLLFDKELEKYAEEKGILLIPGAEFEINGKHILGINIDQEIETIDTYQKLAEYKKTHPDCLIIAAHPFFPGKSTLKQDLVDNIDLFDAIENSFCYTKTKNFNQKAKELAKKWKKPLLATADCHRLKDLDLGYTLVKSQKNTKSIIDAIKKNKIKIHTTPVSYLHILHFILQVELRNLFKGRQKATLDKRG